MKGYLIFIIDVTDFLHLPCIYYKAGAVRTKALKEMKQYTTVDALEEAYKIGNDQDTEGCSSPIIALDTENLKATHFNEQLKAMTP